MSANETPLSDVRFLTVAEVASIMRVSKMTVYRLVHSGELEAIRVGRSFRVPEQAVNQYLRDSFVAASELAWPAALVSPRQLPLAEDTRLGRYCKPLACKNVGVCPSRRVSGVRRHACWSWIRRARVVLWAPSSRSAAREWPRRSTASCCGRPAYSGGTRSDPLGAFGSARGPVICGRRARYGPG